MLTLSPHGFRPPKSRQPDEDVVTAMAISAGRSRSWMGRHLSQWSYDHSTATYWLLLAAKRRGEPVRLAPAAAQVRLSVHSQAGVRFGS